MFATAVENVSGLQVSAFCLRGPLELGALAGGSPLELGAVAGGSWLFDARVPLAK